ncbi:MAG: hypothetical protein HOV78_20350 [Hamadaea sp.]|nr:hypothetical protein [Hamadaea sp.]NUO90633.1 hypothetical protein [Dermatophilaceae bacterium]
MKSIKAAMVVIAMTAALAACGKSEAPPAAAPTTPTTTSSTTSETPSPTTTTTQAGPDAFISWGKTSEMGDRDMSQATEEQLLSLGNAACEVIKTQPSFGKAVEELHTSLKSMGAKTSEVDAMFRQAVINLCPQYKNLLP